MGKPANAPGCEYSECPATLPYKCGLCDVGELENAERARTGERDLLAFVFFAHEWCWDDIPEVAEIPELYQRWLRDWMPEKELEDGNYEARAEVEEKYAQADAVIAARDAFRPGSNVVAPSPRGRSVAVSVEGGT